MKITLDKKILGGFAICSVVLLVVAGISYRNSERLVATGELVNHTNEVIYELDQVLISSVNAETGVRGYVITNDESYLEPFNDAKSKLFVHIDNVKRLTVDNSAQQFNIRQIEDRSIALMDHLEKKIALRRKDFEQARQMVLSGEGKRIHIFFQRYAVLQRNGDGDGEGVHQ